MVTTRRTRQNSAGMLIKALLVLGVLLGSAERGWGAFSVSTIQKECPASITDTVGGLMQFGGLFNGSPPCVKKNNVFTKNAAPASQKDIAAVAAAAIAKNGGKDTTTGGSGICDGKILGSVLATIKTYCDIRATDPQCKGAPPTESISAVGSDLTCGSKTVAETCSSKIEPLIDPTNCPLDAAQKTQLLELAKKAGICAGTNQAYGGSPKTFVQQFCQKTKDPNCPISQKSSGELNCEGGVSFELLQFKDACMPCTIIEKMVEVTAGLGKKVFDGIQRGTFSLLATAVGIWLLVQVGKLLFPFGPLDRVSGIFNGVVTKLGLTLIVGTLLLSFGSYWKYIYAPVITSSVNYTNSILQEANIIISGVPKDPSADATCAALPDTLIIDNATEAEADARKIGKSITCLLKEMQATIYTGLSFSVEAMFQTLTGRSEDQPAPNNTPIFGGLITLTAGLFNSIYNTASTVATVSNVWGAFVTLIGGGILILTWLPLYLNLPFRIADIVIRWTIISMLSPLMIAGAVFPATRGFMMAGLRGIFQSAFELMLIGVIMALCTAAMQDVIELSRGDKTPFTVSSALFLQLWTIAWLANIMMGKVQSFAVAFADPSDAQGQGLDTSVASEYAKRMEGMATEGAKKGANAASDVTAAVGQKEIK